MRKRFLDLLKKKIVILDGAYGSEFIKRGYSTIPGELLNLKFPEVVEKLHKEYVAAGADIILTNTFNANRIKLKALGLDAWVEEINIRAVEIARRAANGNALVFGNISSTGKLIRPLGPVDFTEAYDAFLEQASLLNQAGIDGYVIETITDIKELKAAILAIRSIDVTRPLIAQMTFEKNDFSITGTSVAIFAAVLEDLDVDVIGVNCTLRPQEMESIAKDLIKFSTRPISVEPNAGLPQSSEKYLSYSVCPEEFVRAGERFLEIGVSIIGGCCGISPEHIKLLAGRLKEKKPEVKERSFTQSLTSRIYYHPLNRFTIIGERINPSTKRDFQTQIIEGNYQKIIKEAEEQKNDGAQVIDVNPGIESLLVKENIKDITLLLDSYSSLPISFDIQTEELLEIALREYPGRPLINSACVTPESLESRIKLLKKYGGMLVLLAMGKELKKTPEERFKTILEGLNVLEQYGINRDRIIADPLVLALASGSDSNVTLKTISLLTGAGIKTTMGLSNLSYGLSERSLLNGSFLAQALAMGLTSVIMNPGDSFVMGCLRGGLMLRNESFEKKQKIISKNPLVNCMLNGDIENARKIIQKELIIKSPEEVNEQILIHAMENISKLYDENIIYLPQLLLAGETFQHLYNLLKDKLVDKGVYRGKVLLATVEGDIHDIGKKVVEIFLRSGGFEVVDLGEDVPAHRIFEGVKNERPDILGLSAMMTTTVDKIKEVVLLVKKHFPEVKIIAGGASMNAILAEKFQCDGYAENGLGSLELCKNLIKKKII